VTGETFSAADRDELAARGIPEEEAQRQIDLLRHTPSPIVLDRASTVGDGIVALSAADQHVALARGRDVVAAGRVTKFVPASGAATRMFQALSAALTGEARPSANEAARPFFDALDELPFSAELRLRAGIAGSAATEADERALLRALLHDMRFAELPKGLVPFHRSERPRTAFEEQLIEGVGYTRGSDGVARMHFTVVPSAREAFVRLLEEVRPAIDARYQCSLQVSFSEQHPATDTVAIDASGAPFRRQDGRLLFRPAGHGALLDNLQELGGDVVVIKNIDNILPAERTSEVVRWKLILIGVLAGLEAEVARLREQCRETDDEAVLAGIVGDVQALFGRSPQAPLTSASAMREWIAQAIERPLRVCGVVRNEGEPGGAPFWVRHHDGTRSQQIVESAQVDLADPGQKAIFASSTHFNPVDLVCAVRDAAGRPYSLAEFVDPSAAFVTRKSSEGRELVALERPGLWNGAMAHWNTVNVEVPAATFAPVKTVLDLLRPQHR
jgi:hypothetical protein